MSLLYCKQLLLLYVGPLMLSVCDVISLQWLLLYMYCLCVYMHASAVITACHASAVAAFDASMKCELCLLLCVPLLLHAGAEAVHSSGAAALSPQSASFAPVPERDSLLPELPQHPL